MTDKFDEFIKSQAQRTIEENSAQITPEQGKEWWLNKLVELYALVNKSLEDYVKSGDVKITRFPVTLNEEQLGSYQSEQLEILLGRQVVRLKPVGTVLIGARGRVDMIGPRGSVRFVIVPRASEKPSLDVTASIAGQVIKPIDDPKRVPAEEWGWKISTFPPRIRHLELNSQSFRDALMGVVNGES